MKILEIAYSLTSGGAERFVVDLCNKLSINEDVVLLTLLNMNKDENSRLLPDLSHNVRHISTNGSSGYSLSNFWKTLSVIIREKPDVVHIHCGALILLAPAIFLRKTIFIHTIHSLAQRYSPGFIKTAITRFLYACLHVIPVTISETCHMSYKDYYGLDNDVLITNGCKPLKTTGEFETIESSISKLKQHQDTPIFIHVARNHPVKNHERLFKTFRQLSNEGVDYLLLVIGDNYESMVNSYINDDKILFLGNRNNVGDFMALADFFVLSSDAEGLPLTLLEAMSMGVVPICTPAGGVKDVIVNGKNGYMADEISDECFSESIHLALSEKGKIKKNDIIKEYQENYSDNICHKKYLDLFIKELQKQNNRM